MIRLVSMVRKALSQSEKPFEGLEHLRVEGWLG